MKTYLITCLLTLCMQISASSQESKKSGQVEVYRLQQGDSISMTIYQEPDMTVQAMIGKSGMLSFRLIGNVYIKGYTVPELEKKLRDLYQEDYFVDPKISIIIGGYAQKYVTVSGAVLNPGGVPYPDEGTITLAQAVAHAGGILETGNDQKINLSRRKGGAGVYTLVSGGNIQLAPGDTVVVPRLPIEKEARIITATVSGEVNRPGNIALPQAGELDILTALAMAGGFSRIANQKEGLLQRKVGAGYRVEEVRLKDIRNGKAAMVHIREGDILIIKESRF